MVTPAVPQRCGQQLRTLTITYTCQLAADHRAAFHMDIANSATWTSPADLVLLTPSMRDLAGGVLDVELSGMWEQADFTGGATDSPFTAPPPSRGEPACGQRYAIPGPDLGSHQAEYRCSRPAGHYAEPHRDHAAGVSWSRAGDLRPTSLAVGMASVDALTALANERGEMIARYRAAIACEGPCSCGPVTGEDGDRETDPLCPVDGTVAQMARQLRWADSFTSRIMAALPFEWRQPFHGGDAAGEVVRRVQLSEHASNCEAAISRIADRARQALGAETTGVAKLEQVLSQIVAECERGDR